ncbi:MAG: iron-containing alcohol dehydrogenase [Clostridia bacterium]|nr:iron-containing alcohol dehydrogenase [Clostridia bacterium]
MNRLQTAYCRAYQKVMKAGSDLIFTWKEPEIIGGAGAVKNLAKIIKEKGFSKPLIVTDPGLMKLNLLAGLFESIEAEGYSYALYDQVVPNPTIENIEAALKVYNDNACDCVIAFGGGSSMDCAKIAAARAAHPDKSVEKMRGMLKVGKGLPTIFAVPTTAGTGSETTIAAVITGANHTKVTILDPAIRPPYAVLDPELTLGLPPFITAPTGLDALTHAVEAYIGKSNTKNTEAKARQAVNMIYKYLPVVYEDGKNIEAREQMLLASYYAGVAFTQAYVGYVHAFAHAIGGMYGIAHGSACATILPEMLKYYGYTCSKQLADLADEAGIQGKDETCKAKKFIKSIQDLNASMGIPARFEQLEEKDFNELADRILAEANPLYPVPKEMDRNDVLRMLKHLKA